MKNVANYLLFQAGWFAAILSVRDGLAWPGPAAAVAVAAITLFFSDRRGAEFALLAGVTLVGGAVDSGLTAAGIVRFEVPNCLAAWLAPWWIFGQWLNFAATLRSSLAWLGSRPVLAALFGAVGGPLAYRASAELGAVTLHSNTFMAYTALAIEWAVLTPLVVTLAERTRTPVEATVAPAPFTES